jgi:hypothetical protein
VSPEQQALSVFWSHKRFWLLQTLAIAAWMALALAWFWLPDSRVWGVVLSALLGVVVIGGGLWLIGAALVYYRNPGPIWRESLRRIPALFVWIALFALAIWASLKAPGWTWMLPAILLLQLALPLKSQGRARFLLDTALLVGAGVYLPYKLIGWHPQLSGLAMQTASLAVRFLLAYLLAVGAWLILASLIVTFRRRAQ